MARRHSLGDGRAKEAEAPNAIPCVLIITDDHAHVVERKKDPALHNRSDE